MTTREHRPEQEQRTAMGRTCYPRALLWGNLCPPKFHVEAIASRTSKCDCIWKWVLKEAI